MKVLQLPSLGSLSISHNRQVEGGGNESQMDEVIQEKLENGCWFFEEMVSKTNIRPGKTQQTRYSIS